MGGIGILSPQEIERRKLAVAQMERDERERATN